MRLESSFWLCLMAISAIVVDVDGWRCRDVEKVDSEMFVVGEASFRDSDQPPL